LKALFLIAGAYAIGAWCAAIYVCAHWLRNERVTVAAYLRVTGWCAVGVFLFALAADFA
jgi:hypothetical protein